MHHLETPITLQDIESDGHPSSEYVILTFYFPGQMDGRVQLKEIITQVHIVDRLKAKMLISTDTIDSQGMILDFPLQRITFDKTGGFTTDIRCRTRGTEALRRIVKSTEAIIIPAHSIREVSIKTGKKLDQNPLPCDRRP